MANSNSKRNGSIAAVAYYRMSSDKQETSISEQRAAVQRYAADHGYSIIREYLDEGISGDATDKRTAFLQMHQDACNGRYFDSILCWDQDRFGRFDSMEAGYYIHPLRKAGVTLVTVSDGPIDWDDFSGRMMFTIKQEGKHQQLRDIACNSQRGVLAKAQRGEWPKGRLPLGYTVDEDHRLVLGHAGDVELVRRIFRDYLAGGSLNDLAVTLNQQGIRARRGGKWYREAVRVIIKRRLYTGDFVWNVSSSGSCS